MLKSISYPASDVEVMRDGKMTRGQNFEEMSSLHHLLNEVKRLTQEHRHAEDLFKRNDVYYRTAVELSNDAAVMISGEKRIYFNRKYLDLLGYERAEEIEDKPVSFAVHPDDYEMVKALREGRRKGEKSAPSYEFRMIRRDGATIHVEASWAPIHYSGEPASLVFLKNVEERKEIEKNLIESEHRFRVLFEQSPAAICISTTDGKIVESNTAMQKMFGYSADEMKQICMADFYTNSDQETYLFRTLRRDAHVDHCEVTLNRKNGTSFNALLSVAHVQGVSGPFIQTILMDVSEQRRAQENLRRSEENYRQLVESANSIVLRRDPEGKILFVNTYAQQFFGYSESELVGVNVLDTIVPKKGESGQDLKEMILDIGRLPEKYASNQNENVKKNGERVWIAWTNKGIRDEEGSIIEILCIGNDITAKKKAEEALRESEERLRTLAENAPIGIAVVNPDLTYDYVNPRFSEITGYTLDDLPDKNAWFEKAYPDSFHREQVKSVWKTDILDRPVVGRFRERVFTIRCGDESNKIVDIRTTVTESGKLVITLEDITERMKVEEDLRSSEEKYRLLVEGALDGIVILQDAVIKFANQSIYHITGYAVDDIIGNPLMAFIHPDDRDRVMDTYQKRQRGEPAPSRYEIKIISRSGDMVWCEISNVLITWEGRAATLIFLRDINQQKILESQLLQAQKMEAIGTLAGGIAHDFNNLLMGIEGYASLVYSNMGKDNPNYEMLKSIEQLVRSGSDLTRQLLGFARGGQYEVRPTDLNDLVMRTSEMFGRTRKEISIFCQYPEGLWKVEVDRGQIEQVMLNLCLNAWQAMPVGGELQLTTDNVELSDKDVQGYNVCAGRYVRLSVSDTGVGMDEATCQRIFEPFFTTRKMGRGTGLGLASAYGIIKNHGGFIRVESERGRGSTFTIYLPAVDKDDVEEALAVTEALRGSETILLVDDEKTNLETTAELLRMLEYKIYVAGSGQEALAVFQEKRGKIDLVILDMVMPGISGGETFDRLKELDPGVKVLLCSGYSVDGKAKEILSRGCNGFIQKPFVLPELTKRMRDILDQPSAGCLPRR